MLLITGSNGQLGSALSKLFHGAILTDKTELDITDSDSVKGFIDSNNIDTIINCASYTNVDNAEDNADLAYVVNCKGVENLAKTGCKIVHISTDYVFDGKKSTPYLTTDEVNPISVYGKTKLDGENSILNYADTFLIIRTSWMYSKYGNNFVKTIKKLASCNDNINVVYDQVGTPTNAEDLADAICQIIPQMNKKTNGIYHFSNEGVCSWYDFAYEIVDLLDMNCNVNPILSSKYPSKVKRPSYSVLDKSKIKEAFKISISNWKESLEKCLKRF